MRQDVGSNKLSVLEHLAHKCLVMKLESWKRETQSAATTCDVGVPHRTATERQTSLLQDISSHLLASPGCFGKEPEENANTEKV